MGRDPGRSWAGPRVKELVLEGSFSENIVAAHMRQGRCYMGLQQNRMPWERSLTT